MSKVLKKLELKTEKEWKNMGIQTKRIWSFRQGGDEFCLVVHGQFRKEATLQKLYNILKTGISKIMVENMENKKYLTVSVGVCLGYKITDYEYMMRKADTCAEVVKKNGRDNIRIWKEHTSKMYSDFNDV
eukprot:435564_1